jgi:predicted TIM-barrel fold metal-dependent hydrolase
MLIDVHQHLLPGPLLEALARRRAAPRIRRGRSGWLLEVAGETPSSLDLGEHDPDARARRAEADRIDHALVALSSVLGVEGLDAGEAGELIAAWDAGALDLPNRFGHWGAVSLRDPDPAQVDRALRNGAVGISLPAGALASEGGVDRSGPLLDRIDQRSGVLFVHPGPDPWSTPPTTRGGPAWLPALTRYVAEMNAAWHVLATIRGRLPRTRVVFAMLAGLAPLHVERLQARGGPSSAVLDRNLFYDTSSYGPRAVRAMARVVGPEQLVYGSDRPVVEPHPLVAPAGGRSPAQVASAGPPLPYSLAALRLFPNLARRREDLGRQAGLDRQSAAA